MSLDQRGDRPVHYPADPNKFSFDREVAPIFPDMARRSIPNYEAFHRTHARMVARWFIKDKGTRILDVGASRGEFFYQLQQFYIDSGLTRPPMQRVALDNSEAMCGHLRIEFPDVEVRQQALDEPLFTANEEQFDIINCTYVLQFIHPDKQLNVLRKLISMLSPHGVLILGQKEAHEGALGHMLHEEYIRWRIDNGYTREEIEAKNRALAGSMWPMHPYVLRAALKHHFTEIAETSRFAMFTTLFCMKGGKRDD